MVRSVSFYDDHWHGAAGNEFWYIEGVEEFGFVVDFCSTRQGIMCPRLVSNSLCSFELPLELGIPLPLLPESGITEVHHQLRGAGDGARAL